MCTFFKSNNSFKSIYKHESLPIYKTDEFSFFRCVEFNDCLYGKTVSELHRGNLRKCNGRYSKLFPNQQISYWADSPSTAHKEIRKHGSGKNIITFWAYDDVSSTISITSSEEYITIIDGRKCGIQELIDKIDEGRDLSMKDEEFMQETLQQKPDCLVYDSRVDRNGENYIFLEKGFRKLAIKELRIRLGDKRGKNTNRIMCADSSDYMPIIDGYACYFLPIAKVGINKDYYNTDEYDYYKHNYDVSMEKIRAFYGD